MFQGIRLHGHGMTLHVNGNASAHQQGVQLRSSTRCCGEVMMTLMMKEVLRRAEEQRRFCVRHALTSGSYLEHSRGHGAHDSVPPDSSFCDGSHSRWNVDVQALGQYNEAGQVDRQQLGQECLWTVMYPTVM
jgi:hypothetical protein